MKIIKLLIFALITLAMSCELPPLNPDGSTSPPSSKRLVVNSVIRLDSIINVFNNEYDETVLQFAITNTSHEFRIDTADVMIQLNNNNVFTYINTNCFIDSVDTMETVIFYCPFKIDSGGSIIPVFTNERLKPIK
jgi:hypothetical protein